MKKILILVVVSLVTYTSYAQTDNVGVNTQNPQATLDVVGKPSTSTSLDGIIAPRLTGDQLKAKRYTTAQRGAMVYVTAAASTANQTGQTVHVKAAGQYVFDGAEWQSVSTEPWRIVGTANSATVNTQDIYQNGKVGVGFGSTDPFTLVGANQTSQLEVKGGDAVINGLTVGKGSSGKNGNTAMGFRALYSNTRGEGNTATGSSALSSNTMGYYNTATGGSALYSNTTGGGNTAMGSSALVNNTTGNYNVAMGASLANNTTGSNNVAMGHLALSSTTTGSNNIGIGAGANVPVAANNNQVRIGNDTITYAGIQVAWTTTSDKRWKKDIRSLPYGLNFVNKLRPVDYTRKNNESNTKEIGFIAQEVEQTLRELGYENTGILTQDDRGYMSLRYNDFIPVLTKSIQEQQAQLEAQQQEIKRLSGIAKQVDSQNKKIAKLEAMVDQLLKTANR